MILKTSPSSNSHTIHFKSGHLKFVIYYLTLPILNWYINVTLEMLIFPYNSKCKFIINFMNLYLITNRFYLNVIQLFSNKRILNSRQQLIEQIFDKGSKYIIKFHIIKWESDSQNSNEDNCPSSDLYSGMDVGNAEQH